MCLALPGRVVHVWWQDSSPMATVDIGGLAREVCLEFVPDLQVGEYTIVHAGFALQRLDEAAAGEALALFDRLDELDDRPDHQLGGRRVGAGSAEPNGPG